MIRVARLEKLHAHGGGTVRALAGVDLEVARGEFVAIVGRSGSGKSTVLHLIGGLDEPTGGAIEVDGHDLTSMSDDARTAFRRRTIGLVYQFFHLLPSLSAGENVALTILSGLLPALRANRFEPARVLSVE